jgi:phenylalanyl-tRNA synthetase beta chain
MRVSEQWLREWVNPAVSSAELMEQLTMAGLEVDSVEPAAPAFSGIVVGRVVELNPHPDAERLRVALVDVGQAEPLRIVCGAPNVQLGMHAPTALVGAVLPGDFKIKKSKLRGIVSLGMLCSAKELGLAESAEGLLPLPADSRPGQEVRELLALDDNVIEVDLTPNRGDCLGMAGIAREVGVLNRCEVAPLPLDPVPPMLDADFPIALEAPEDCPRYVGRIIRGVDPTATTPLWIGERLRRAGVRSLGPLVDVTNYVMLELGQPMHAFDLDKLSGGIRVRRAEAGETLRLLDGNQVTLDPETLLIADHSGPLALAGIMGGATSAVGDDTRNLLLESAFFTPPSIAGRARRYGAQTDASHRFERGVDPQLQAQAMERATRLLLAIVGGEPGPILEAASQPHLPTQPSIRLRSERIRRVLGVAIPAHDVVEILRRLGMAVAQERDHWLVVPPAFRFDVVLEEDLIEEIGRIYGYSRLPSHRPLMRLAMSPRPEGWVSLERLGETLVQRGYQEAVIYSFVDPAFQQALDPARQPIALANPISADLAVMRTSLWPGLAKAVAYNQKRQQSRIRLFECGLNFIPEGASVNQETFIGGAVWGHVLSEQWDLPPRPVDFYDLKADVEALLALTGRPEDFTFVAARHPALHPGQTARVERDGAEVGWVGALHPAIEERLDLEGKVFVFELRVSGIRQGRVPAFDELSKYPASRRDIAILVDEGVTAQAVEDCIRVQGGELLRETRLFDVYRGKGIPDGKKSMALGLILQDFSRNLTESVVDETVSKIVSELKRRLGATLRM